MWYWFFFWLKANATYFDAVEDRIDVIGYESEDDLQPIQDQITVNAGKMTETLLINPMGEMLEAVGIDVGAAVSGMSQTGLGAFWIWQMGLFDYSIKDSK